MKKILSKIQNWLNIVLTPTTTYYVNGTKADKIPDNIKKDVNKMLDDIKSMTEEMKL